MEIRFTGEIHPLADRFPLLPDDDLHALAEDIQANGLNDPPTINPDGVLLDGRNRLAACAIAGIEPEFQVHDGDPAAFIISQNLQRRDLNQGQKAHLAIALLTQIVSTREAAKIAGVPQQRIAEAQIVAQWAPDLVDQVIAGTMPHSTAHEQAKTLKDEATRETAQRANLKTHRPDLAALVEEGKLQLDEAFLILKRDQDEEEKNTRLTHERDRKRNVNLHTGYAVWMSMQHPDIRREIEENYEMLDKDLTAIEVKEFGEWLLELSNTWRSGK